MKCSRIWRSIQLSTLVEIRFLEIIVPKTTLTQEQQEIYDFVAVMMSSSTIKSMGIKAFAGCGKSFVLKYIATHYSQFKFLGLAFGSNIAAENKKSFPKRNTKWLTVHGFARTYLKAHSVNFDFKNARGSYKSLELIEILKIKDSGDYKLAEAIAEIMKVFCQSAHKEITPVLILKAGVSQKNENVVNMNKAYMDAGCKYAIELWKKLENNEISPTFDFYLKYFEVNRFAEKITEFDIIELDEAQDSNAVTMSIIYQLPAKRIYVGDEHQSIFEFRGTLNAMNYADKLFYLSTTFRYIPDIAKMANEILNTYKREKIPIKSLANTSGYVDGVTAYLSRNNSSMIALIDSFVKEKKEFRTAKDPKELFAVALALLKFKTTREIDDERFFYLKRFQDMEQVEEYIEDTDDNELKTAFKMVSRYNGYLITLFKIASKYYKSKDEIKYILSTAHTSKGLEWDSVKLLSDFPDIMRLLKEAQINSSSELMKKFKAGDIQASNIIQEINLFYVAITRARFNIDFGVSG